MLIDSWLGDRRIGSGDLLSSLDISAAESASSAAPFSAGALSAAALLSALGRVPPRVSGVKTGCECAGAIGFVLRGCQWWKIVAAIDLSEAMLGRSELIFVNLTSGNKIFVCN